MFQLSDSLVSVRIYYQTTNKKVFLILAVERPIIFIIFIVKCSISIITQQGDIGQNHYSLTRRLIDSLTRITPERLVAQNM